MPTISRLRTLGPALLAGLIVPGPAGAFEVYSPIYNNNFCGADRITIPVTICGFGAPGQLYLMELIQSSFPCCEIAVVPPHDWPDANPNYIGAEQCETFYLEVDKPAEFATHDNVCFYIRVEPSQTGGVIARGAKLIDKPLLCVDWNFVAAVAFLFPDQPVAIDPKLINLQDEVLVLDYEIQARGTDGVMDMDAVSLNGRAPGIPVQGTLDVPPHGAMSVPLEASLRQGYSGFYEIVLLVDENGDGEMEETSSMGLHEAVPVPAAADDGSLSAGTMRVSPNPIRSSATVSFDAAGEAALLVYDMTGRLVRRLPPESGGKIRWDTRDALGTPVPAGAYLLELRSGGTREIGKVVVLR